MYNKTENNASVLQKKIADKSIYVVKKLLRAGKQ